MAKKRTNGSYQLNSFAGIPRIVMDHPDYIGLSFSAKTLLFELARQYRKSNNGDLTAAWTLMKQRGFGSKQTVTKAVSELVAANLVVRTRQGYFTNPGGVCALYALTWLPIDDCPGKGLEVEPTVKPPRGFSLKANKSPGPHCGLSSAQILGRRRQRDGSGRYLSS